MELFVVGEKNSIANHFLRDLRDRDIQLDRMKFRASVERLGEIMAFEVSKRLTYVVKEIDTPLGKSFLNILANDPILITILRAGLPYFSGFQHFFDASDCGFIGAYRQENEKELTIKLDYLAIPRLHNADVILIDPMLATGSSLVDGVEELLKRGGTPNHIHLATLIASPEGIQYVQKKIKVPSTIWTFAVDEKLNQQSYIVPGLGDAGDLSFGEKL
jgi:uracil phosphoribosyltransferase